MKQVDYLQQLFAGNKIKTTIKQETEAWAPINVALIKYWGKRDQELNLPITSSLGRTIDRLGAHVKLSLIQQDKDQLICNNNKEDDNGVFFRIIETFLLKLRPFLPEKRLKIAITINLPVMAGLASSAAIFCALTKAFNQLCSWGFDNKRLSLIARLGSGSATRSFGQGFSYWHAGEKEDGTDSFSESLPINWPELDITILLIKSKKKGISSREAMKRAPSSEYWPHWPGQVTKDLADILKALAAKDLPLLGSIAERNSRAMHRVIATSTPPLNYDTRSTKEAIVRLHRARRYGYQFYFTQDAGPNLKIIHRKRDFPVLRELFQDFDLL